MVSCRICRSVLLAVALPVAWTGTANAQTETENFDVAPADWVAAGDPDTYGFRNTNNTNKTGGNGAGEAGGTFKRDSHVAYYADVTLGGLINQNTAFTASGELSVSNYVGANSENLIAHFEQGKADQVGDGGDGANNVAGLHILDSSPGNIRFRTRIYDSDAPNGTYRHDGEEQVVAYADIRSFSYSWDPTTRQLTGQVFNDAGTSLGTSIATLPEGKTFSLNAFGLYTGLTGDPNPETETHDEFIDAVTYSRAVLGDFNGSTVVNSVGAVTPEDFDLLGEALRGASTNRMFDVNDSGTITLADRDAILTSINKKLGDTDLDGDVDLNDLGNLASGFQQAGASWGRGDTDLDNDVDLNDLGNLASNFGGGSRAVLAAFDALIPEPSALSLLAMGAAGMLRRLRV